MYTAVQCSCSPLIQRLYIGEAVAVDARLLLDGIAAECAAAIAADADGVRGVYAI